MAIDIDLPHRENYRVRAYEVGPGGQLPPALLANFLQETAGSSAEKIGVGMEMMMARGLAWVLMRLYLQVHRLPGTWERITVETWPEYIGPRNAGRSFVILDEAGEELARATTLWIVFDLEARSMIRIPEEIQNAMPEKTLPPAASFPERTLPRLDLDSATAADSVRVRPADLDILGHTNNVHYLEWTLASLPADAQTGKSLRAVDIMFRREAALGDRVVPLVQQATADPAEPALDNTSWLHSLQDEARHELVRARTVWTAQQR